MTAAALRTAPARHAFTLNIGETLAMLSLAALTLGPLLRTAGAAAFLTFGTLLIVSQLRHSLASLVRWWPFLILPAFCLASALWSQFPDGTIRYSIQMSFTLAVAIVIACRVPPADLLRGLFVLYSFGLLLCLGIGRNSDGAAWVGIFESKNAFAAFVAVYALICVGLLCDRGAPSWLRMAATGGALLSLPVLIRAQSAGALAVIGPAVLTVLIVMSSRYLSEAQRVFLVCLGALAALALVLVFMTYGSTLLAAFLETSGKDSTLTGRTDLWRVGLSIISEHPLFGIGYRGFWVKGYGPAEQLWAMFGEQSGAGFNFHNTYISNAVELGLVGLGIEVAIIYGSVALLIALAVVRPTHIVAFLLGLQVLLILRSFVEVEVFYEFSVRSMLTYCTAIYAVRDWQRWRAERLVPRPRRPMREATDGAQ